ncbi:MAG: glycosyltransferase family 2 protein [Bacteroidales bacterium]|nr:glycosyltransferase family 2 protein [Bacteroidales bacterium]
MNKLLTIVVPVYKVEPYINKCLDSCVVYKTNEQGEKIWDEDLMNLLEVIIVNDGTPDRSAEMSREYVKRYPQTFRQIDKENGGHGSAWNVGLKEATGKYLRFLDSDDWLTNLDKLMVDLQSCEADVVFTPFAVSYQDNNEVIPPPIPIGSYGKTVNAVDIWGASKYLYSNYNFWSGTYKTVILSQFQTLFAEGVMYDDAILTWAPLVCGRTCMAFDYVLYNYYVERPNNSMSETVMEKCAHSYEVCFKQFEVIRSRASHFSVPTDSLNCIDAVITDYARFVFWYEAFLPYKKAKKVLSHIYNSYLTNAKKSAVMRRYEYLPFFLFYYLEHFRNFKNK